ncbi:MAG: hypothetical protein U0Z44_15385 [Kouleothrix sp.]
MHADWPGKPSLTLDLDRGPRQAVVDRTLIGQVNRGFAIVQDDEGRLDGPTRKRIVEKVLERMESTEPYEGKRQPLRHILQLQARHRHVRARRAACVRAIRDGLVSGKHAVPVAA